MKKIFILIGLIFSLFIVNTFVVQAEDTTPTVVYFYSHLCGDCNATTPDVEKLKDEGINVIMYDVVYKSDNNLNVRMNYQYTYGATDEKYDSGPILFAGDKFYHGSSTILNAIKSGDIQKQAQKHLLDVDSDGYKKLHDVRKYQGVVGFFYMLGVGLIDGVNPCAMAMLLLFISLLIGMQNKKRTIIGVSIAYILGLFITYFALGAFLVNFLGNFNMAPIQLGVNIFILSLAVILFVFNIYDFIVSRNEEFGKIKNQLPKPIQKLNKKIIKYFTKSIEGKNVFLIYGLTFSLGVIISMTEFLCTGQIYLPTILILDQLTNSYLMKLYGLLVYNIAFVIPLILLAIFAIKSNSVISTSDKIRQHLSLIKLLNALIFLGVIIYFVYRIFF